MRTRAAAVAIVFLTCLTGTQAAFPWGSLTHAFLTGRIVTEDGVIRDNAVYGSTAPDAPLFLFGSPYQVYLTERTHVDFLRVWKMAGGGPVHAAERAAAFGFVAHNVEDYIAHSMSLTLDPAEGYVTQKAAILDAMLTAAQVWDELGISGEQFATLRADLSHQVIEFAGDLYVALFLDPTTGQLLSNAAAADHEGFPELLIKAYAGNLVAFSTHSPLRLNRPEAAGLLTGNEEAFRAGMATYGSLFTGADPTQNVAVYLQALAKLQGIEIEDVDLVVDVLGAALQVIASDFAGELEATVPFVTNRLALLKVAY